MLLKPGEGDEIVIGPTRMLVKTTANSDRLFIAEHTFPPGFAGPGSHQHPEMAHAFFVLEGRVRFSVDGVESIGEPGTFAYVAPTVIHSFGSGGAEPARLLEINIPGGFDRYYAELARAFPAGTAIDPEVLRDLQRQHGIVPV
jgi:quercetin dioxygenase-like cupin family protein